MVYKNKIKLPSSFWPLFVVVVVVCFVVVCCSLKKKKKKKKERKKHMCSWILLLRQIWQTNKHQWHHIRKYFYRIFPTLTHKRTALESTQIQLCTFVSSQERPSTPQLMELWLDRKILCLKKISFFFLSFFSLLLFFFSLSLCLFSFIFSSFFDSKLKKVPSHWRWKASSLCCLWSQHSPAPPTANMCCWNGR